MPNITLPDGKKLSFKNNVTGLQVAEKISKSLSKQALITVSYTHLRAHETLRYRGCPGGR